MLTRLAFILLAVIGATVSGTLGGIVLKSFRYTPLSVVVIVVTIVGLTPFIYFGKKLMQKHADDPHHSLQIWLSRPILSFLAYGAGVVMAAFACFHSNRTDFYFDNGTEKAITFNLDQIGEYTAEPGKFVLIPVPLGQQKITVGKQDTVLTINKHGKWVFNPEKKNMYLETSIFYGDHQAATHEDMFKNIHFKQDKFFCSDAEYMFEAPETISVKKREANQTIEKKLLMRIASRD